VLERLGDLAARQLKMGPGELRRQNLLPPGGVPLARGGPRQPDGARVGAHRRRACGNDRFGKREYHHVATL